MPKILDLDALAIEPLQVRLDGAVVAMLEPSLTNKAMFDEQARSLKGAAKTASDVMKANIDLLALLLPSLDKARLGALDEKKTKAICDHWYGMAVEAAEADRADFEKAAADPTSPG